MNCFSIAFGTGRPYTNWSQILHKIFRFFYQFSFFCSISDWPPPLIAEVSNKQPNRLHSRPIPERSVVFFFRHSLWVIATDWYWCIKPDHLMPSPAIVVRIFQHKKFLFLLLSRFPPYLVYPVFRSVWFIEYIFFSFPWHSIECILCSISIFTIVRNFKISFIFCTAGCHNLRNVWSKKKWKKEKKTQLGKKSRKLEIPLLFSWYISNLYRRILPKFMESLIGYEIAPF